METAINEKDKEISDLHWKNEELLSYIEILEKSQDLRHKGKEISEVIKKSQTLKKYLSRANVTLWFSRSFGLQVENLIVTEVKSGVKHNLRRSTDKTTNQASNKGLCTLGLCRFCVCDHFYHDLSMVINGLPKSYLIKQRRDQLNKICHINALPGDQEGAQVSFKDLLKDRV